jgi:phage gpG-like protein
MEDFSIKELEKIVDKYHTVASQFTADIAIVAHNFFLMGFVKGGQFINGGFAPWPQRKFNIDRSTKTRKVLTKEGHLSDSIKQVHNANEVRIYTNHPYAAIHNNGGTIKVTPAMRRYFWAMYYASLSNKTFSIKKRRENNNAHNRRSNEIAEIWKSLALTKKTDFTFPKRTFLYNSSNLNTEIEKLLNHRLKQI